MMTSIQDVVNKTSETAVHAIPAGAIGYLCARIFLPAIDPVHAAAVSAISVFVSKVTDPLFKSLFDGENANSASRFVGNIVNLTASIGASVGIANYLGYGISVPAFLYLNAAIIASFALVNLGILALGAVVLSKTEATPAT